MAKKVFFLGALALFFALIFKVYGALKPTDCFPFLVLLPICGGISLIPFTKKRLKPIPQPLDRTSKIYNELLLVHNDYLKRLAIDRYWIFLVFLLSWTLFFFFFSWGLHPSIFVAIFFVATLFMTRILEKEGKKDRQIIALALKGVRVEGQLALSTDHPFSSFVRRRKGFFLFPYALLRAFPPLLPVVALVERSVHYFLPEWRSTATFSLIGLGGIALVGRIIKIYLPLGKKCKIRAYVL